MAGFRFRAQVALDLRAKQDEEAQRALGDARRATAIARSHLREAEHALAETIARAGDAAAAASDTTTAIWYRNWMAWQQQAIAAAAQTLAERESAERLAAEHAMAARRRLRSLERLKDRSFKTFLLAERRLEQKELDALGTLRYASGAGAPGGG